MTDKPEENKKKVLTKDEMYASIGHQEFLTADDKPELEKLYHSKLVKKLLCQILRESDNRAGMMLSQSLISEEDTNRARILQGEARGLAMAVEYIVELMVPKPEGE